VGVAIIRNGTVLFRGGAGEADTSSNVKAHSNTVYRLASVSKAVLGTLAYDMEDAGIIDLDDRSNTLVSGLGSEHTHTVRDLVRMEGCVDHYRSDGIDENATQQSYSTAKAALDNHINGNVKRNMWIVDGCNMGDYNYSTHSYNIAGAALEAEGGQSIGQLIKTRVSDPFGLDTLRVESRTSPNAYGNHAEVYHNGSRVSSSSFQNITWKVGGGGLESSAYDLARFADATLRNRYFPQTVRDQMWQGGMNGQAGGWTVSGNTRWKTGGQQSSDTYLITDVSTGVSVAVLANQRSPSIDTTTLGNQLLGIANAN
jgi:CubicO group peptidase (beta-lactamase class C family)